MFLALTSSEELVISKLVVLFLEVKEEVTISFLSLQMSGSEE